MLQYFPTTKNIINAAHTLKDILKPTPLFFDTDLSSKYSANIYNYFLKKI